MRPGFDDDEKPTARADASPEEFALRYAARGVRVFPCYEAAEGKCACGSGSCSRVAKHPRTRRGLHDATTDIETIRDWWTRWPRANVAIATGSESGLFVLDVDVADDKRGDRALAELVMEHGGLGDVPSVVTGGGGNHYYFKHPGRRVRPSVNRLGPGLDVRGDGAYVIAPPSVHANGTRYSWNIGGQLQQAPTWLLERVLEPEQAPAPPPQRSPTIEEHRAFSILIRECAFIRHAFDDAAHLSYEEWFSLATVLHVFPAGDQLFDEFSKQDGARYRAQEVKRKIRSIRGAPRYCTNLGWSCPKFGQCSALGVRSPAGLPYKLMRKGSRP